MRVVRAALAIAALPGTAVPAVALAADNGGQAAPGPSGSAAAQVRPVARPSGPANPAFQLEAPATSFAGSRVRVTGLLRHGAGRVVRLRYRTIGGSWSSAAATRASRDGSFAAAWTPRRPGVYELRAAARGTRAHASGIRSISIFKAQTATWYGPGFYGKTTACGVVLGEATVGVAHRSLPCGTPVLVTYADRGVVVPVIDRGPYSGTAQWDLTAAAAQAIGITQTSQIGVIVGAQTW